MTTTRNTLAAFALLALLIGAAAITGDDERDAVNAHLARKDAMASAQAQADDVAALERQARATCQQLHGDRAQLLRVAGTGDLVCRRMGVML